MQGGERTFRHERREEAMLATEHTGSAERESSLAGSTGLASSFILVILQILSETLSFVFFVSFVVSS